MLKESENQGHGSAKNQSYRLSIMVGTNFPSPTIHKNVSEICHFSELCLCWFPGRLTSFLFISFKLGNLIDFKVLFLANIGPCQELKNTWK